MSYGLEDTDVKKITDTFLLFPCIQQVALYGSRAKGSYKKGSDIDLCLFGRDLDLPLLYKVEQALDDLFLPYSFDLSIYSHLENQELTNHINRVGIPIYKKH